MSRRVTIMDIAKRAGVSPASVSNVINGIDKVSGATRENILRVMQELNYQPSLVARSLAKRRSDMLGLLLPITEEDSSASLLLRDNPFYGELVSGVEFEAAKLGYDVLIKGVRMGESCRDRILKRDLDGAIFIGNYTHVISEEMQALGRQLVLIDSYDEGTQLHSTVGIDDQQGGYDATRLMIDCGHKSIAIAASNITVDGAIHRRYKGYVKAMTEAGLDAESFIFQDALSFGGGYNIGKALLERPEITAVFAAADIVAFGILKAFYEAGRVIPRDLSIVGFDNTKECEYSMPALSSVAQFAYDRGRITVQKVVQAINDPGAEIENIIMPVELIERDSVAPPHERS